MSNGHSLLTNKTVHVNVEFVRKADANADVDNASWHQLDPAVSIMPLIYQRISHGEGDALSES